MKSFNLFKTFIQKTSFLILTGMLVFAINTGVHAQNLISVPFNEGFVGDNVANNQANSSVYLSSLGWSGIQFAQNSTGDIFVAQGNDIIGMVKITDANGIQHTINGFIKWRAPSGSVTTLVFLPSESKTLATSTSTYTISSSKYIGLTFNGQTLTIPTSGRDAGVVSGNAATSGLLDLLNNYLNALPKITITNSSVSVNETAGTATVTLSLSAVSTSTISVKYATADSTATVGTDYTAVSGTVTFAANDNTPKTISIPIIDDASPEPTEIFKVNFSNPVNASLVGSVALVKIVDNELVDSTAPVITGPNGSGTTTAANSAKSIPENTTPVGTYTASETVTWSISGTDAAKFTMSTGGVLTFTTAPDYEAPTDADGNNTYIVIITATDAAGNTSTQTLTVTVTDVDDAAPVITGPNGSGTTTAANSAKSIPENTTPVGTYTASETVTWSISGDDAAKFTMSTGGVLSFTAAPDYESPTDLDTNNTYVVIITATDAAGNTSTQTLTVTVTDVDEVKPIITGPNGSGTTTAANSAKSIPENTTPVGTYTASETVTWSISGTDAAKFTMSTGGVLTFTTAPDYEVPTDADRNNTYIVIITATDAAGNTSTQTLTVTVTDVDDTPTLITGPDGSGTTTAAISAKSIPENTTAVYTFTANKTVTWSLNGGQDAAKFSITSGGVVTFLAAPDYEVPTDGTTSGSNTYIVVIKAVDAAGNVVNQTLTVTVTNVNEAPTNINLTQSAIYEDNATNAIIGTLSSIDVDAGDTFTYSLVSGDTSPFVISGNQLKATVSFKFDIKNSYSIRIKTTDAGGLSFEKVFTITILKSPNATGTGNVPGSNQITAASNNVTISKGYSSQLDVTGSGLVSYSWSPSTGLSATNTPNPIARPNQTTTYAVTVTNSFGLSTVVYVTVTVIEDYNITANNIITPNGDGINDAWVIGNLTSYPNNEVRVYDKAGRLLYNTKNYQNNWTGVVDGSLLTEGTYYYVITFGSGLNVKKGYITLMRN